MTPGCTGCGSAPWSSSGAPSPYWPSPRRPPPSGPTSTPARTAGLIAGLVTAGLLTAAAHVHRARGGLLAPLIGEDNRLSTSRAVAASWVLLAVFSVLVLALQLAGASGHAQRDALIEGLDLARGAGVVTVLALVCAIAVVVRRVVSVRVLSGRLQKLRADRPRAADLLTDDSGRGGFTDVSYVLVSTAAVLFAAVRLAHAARATARPAVGARPPGGRLRGGLLRREVHGGRQARGAVGGPGP